MTRRLFLLLLTIFLATSSVTARASAPEGAGTDVPGGVLLADTDWVRSGSPYRIHGTVEIPTGVTLRIRPGVRVIGVDNVSNLFLVQGTVRALGSVDRAPLILDGGGNANIFTTEGATESSYIRVNQATVRNGRAFLVANGGEGRFDLLESTVTGLHETTFLEGPGRSHVTKNVIEDSAGWVVDQDQAPYYFNNNRFVGVSESNVWITNNYAANKPTQVHRNTFDTPGVYAVELGYGYSGAAIDAKANYWSTISPSTIQTMILDGNDHWNRYGTIPFEPYLSAPHPDTP